jgi:hypothetical protein
MLSLTWAVSLLRGKITITRSNSQAMITVVIMEGTKMSWGHMQDSIRPLIQT